MIYTMLLSNVSYKEFMEKKRKQNIKRKKKMSNKVNNKCDVFTVIYDVVTNNMIRLKYCFLSLNFLQISFFAPKLYKCSNFRPSINPS